MRTMYDAVTAANIPPGAQLVAGYDDVIKLADWTAADWARFPNARLVRITKKPTTNDGHVLDVETGDATPAQAPGWVTMRRKAGMDPTVYCNASTWPAVQAAFASANVTAPHYWIAEYDGVATIPAGAIAKQYRDPGPYDLSVVADYWPGVDPNPEEDDMALTDAQAAQLMTSIEDIREQLCGSGARTNGFPGWPSLVPGSTAKLTITDYIRNVDARTYAEYVSVLPKLAAAIAAVPAAQVDPAKLVAAGLPQQVVDALLAAIETAAKTTPATS